MTWLVIQTLLWLMAALVAGAITYFAVALTTKIYRGRTFELQASEEALKKYESAFDILMDDPVTPESVRKLLTEFDRGVMNKRAAKFVASSIFRNRSKWLTKNGDEPKVITDIHETGKYRPDLQEAFTTAIASGFMATMLRWFFPARALTFLLVDPRRDPLTPARAVADGADHDHHTPLPQAA